MELPIIGKTYSLYGEEFSSDNYYIAISKAGDEILKDFTNKEELIKVLRNASASKRRLSQMIKKKNLISEIISRMRRDFSVYITGLDEHLSSLSIVKRWDNTLGVNRDQYFLMMLEIEMVKWITFVRAALKIAQ